MNKKILNIVLKIKEASLGSIISVVFSVVLFLFGLFVLFLASNSNLNNTNEFYVPDSAKEGEYTLYSIESENLKYLDFSSLAEQEIVIEDGQKSISFVSSNAKEKLEKFKDQNKGQNFLGMQNGAPDYIFNLYSVSAFPLENEGSQITTEDGSFLYKGYQNFNDLENGQNKQNFSVSFYSIEKLENGTTINTNFGEIELKQGD